MSGHNRRIPACSVCHRRPGFYSRWLHGTICRRCWRKAFRRQVRRWIVNALLHPHLASRSWWSALWLTVKAWLKGR